MNYGTDVEERTLGKIRRAFLPIIGICLFVLYMDRLNVSVAALRMDQELGVSLTAYGLIAGAFFWTYAICEIPSNFLLQRFGARVWVTRIIISWGLVTMATAAAHDGTSLLILRLLLGIAEAGFAPALVYFISSWFPRAHRGKAIALMTMAVPLSGISTPISTHIMTATDGLLDLSGWRWMFILTGLPAVILGFVFHRIIRNSPSEATFLTDEERAWLVAELASEAADSPGHDKRRFREGVLNPRTGILVVVFILFAFTLYGYQFFLPQMLARFDLSINSIGWLASLPPVLAIGPMIWWARHSDRKQERLRHFSAAALVAAGGLLLAGLGIGNLVVAVIGFCVAGIGIYCCIPIQLSVPSTFLWGPALAGAIATINGVGNIGGYLGPQMTAVVRHHSSDYGPAMLMMGAAAAAAALILILMARWSSTETHPQITTSEGASIVA
jgi:ACS family tartrate transporter-like MFS transporter